MSAYQPLAAPAALNDSVTASRHGAGPKPALVVAAATDVHPEAIFEREYGASLVGHRENIPMWQCCGNTNPGGSRDGYGVFERVRHFGAADRFLHWSTP